MATKIASRCGLLFGLTLTIPGLLAAQDDYAARPSFRTAERRPPMLEPSFALLLAGRKARQDLWPRSAYPIQDCERP